MKKKKGGFALVTPQALAVGFHYGHTSFAFELGLHDSVSLGCFIRNTIAEHFGRKTIVEIVWPERAYSSKDCSQVIDNVQTGSCSQTPHGLYFHFNRPPF
jgi:hypothetical protein